MPARFRSIQYEFHCGAHMFHIREIFRMPSAQKLIIRINAFSIETVFPQETFSMRYIPVPQLSPLSGCVRGSLPPQSRRKPYISHSRTLATSQSRPLAISQSRMSDGSGKRHLDFRIGKADVPVKVMFRQKHADPLKHLLPPFRLDPGAVLFRVTGKILLRRITRPVHGFQIALILFRNPPEILIVQVFFHHGVQQQIEVFSEHRPEPLVSDDFMQEQSRNLRGAHAVRIDVNIPVIGERPDLVRIFPDPFHFRLHVRGIVSAPVNDMESRIPIEDGRFRDGVLGILRIVPQGIPDCQPLLCFLRLENRFLVHAVRDLISQLRCIRVFDLLFPFPRRIFLHAIGYDEVHRFAQVIGLQQGLQLLHLPYLFIRRICDPFDPLYFLFRGSSDQFIAPFHVQSAHISGNGPRSAIEHPDDCTFSCSPEQMTRTFSQGSAAHPGKHVHGIFRQLLGEFLCSFLEHVLSKIQQSFLISLFQAFLDDFLGTLATDDSAGDPFQRAVHYSCQKRIQQFQTRINFLRLKIVMFSGCGTPSRNSNSRARRHRPCPELHRHRRRFCDNPFQCLKHPVAYGI